MNNHKKFWLVLALPQIISFFEVETFNSIKNCTRKFNLVNGYRKIKYGLN